MENESILIHGAQVLDAAGPRRGSVLIEGNTIEEVSDALSPGDADTVIDGHGKLLIPGLVNTHTHLSMTLFRGMADDLPLDRWLNDHIWPAEAHLNGEYCHAGALLGCVEMIRSGTTAFNDMYFYMDDVARAVDEAGLRCVLSHGMIDLGDDDKMRAEIRESLRIIRECHGMADGRIKVALGPHSPYTCSEELLRETARLAAEHGVGIHIHVSETENEVREVSEAHGMSPVEYLDSTGVLGPGTVAAHCVWLKENEMEILSERGVKVSHNPSSNMKLASGISPVPELMGRGVNVSIGTDGAASNNNLDMFEEMKTASLLQKVSLHDPTALPAMDVFRMATVNGAKALGVNSGLIEEGGLADIVVLNTRRPHLTPWRKPASHLVYSASGADVDTVICDGRILLLEGELKVLDEEYVMELAEGAAEELTSKQ
ncbi:amidohydrolase family protein [Methanothermobacter sp. KEPCO-1]|uniref:5'-deoxyadenosine deaminase n=1 Tax=Methanothermobacter marburgensis (strain ATCC BAA-927 / DSM 2133 / JCM 14651 / NBRC 100331 / OCM 82 / Marburg) TaxID=79929 RepID=D9PU02_METTM|nr:MULTISPECIES: amidohydrolase family protein [Methanothermobacter]ADL57700.1 predicted amidohydrolase [Methanothermobacter marburgensis str. Marburg]QEF94406.1 amidohydrolase family protein [Methanothermobacter sp. KEPCO-1]WBF09927.1 amidohydrolase family protein [Methanothermobacter marburgensis]